MYSYQDFEKKIISLFKGIIEKYNFKIMSLSEKHFSTLQLENDNCIIRFTYDTGEVGCVLINPNSESEAVYPVYSVWKYLFPNDKEQFGSNDWNFETQVQNLAHLVQERLRNVLNGDFSWADGYQTNSRIETIRIEYLINSLPQNHPIKEKFWNGDLSWEKDLDLYLLVNSIVLKG